MNEIEIGEVQHYFAKPSVAAIVITDGTLAVGDTIHIKGHTTDVTTTIESMQIEHGSVTQVNKGDNVGVKVPGKVRGNDKVFKVVA